MSVNLNNPDPPPSGAVTATRDYWKVGDGLPDSGGQVGYTLDWLDADDNQIGCRKVDVVGSVTITEAEYDVLIEEWT